MLASSSSGNATFVSSGRTRILIDAGLSRKEIIARLQAIGETPEALDAVLISHEHSDHVCGLLPLIKKFRLPVYVSRLTVSTIPWEDHEWGENTPKIRLFQAGETFQIGDLEIGTFTVPHDAVDPVGFRVRSEDACAGIVTDLGYIPDSVKYHLRDCNLLLLESNHDLDMLKVGPYPWSVKQRVMGRNGHLSNDTVSQFILEALDGRLRTLILGHLSEHNNHPALVQMSAAQALFKKCLGPRLVVAEPRTQSEVFTV
ncbi:MAG TPA: MBL fold metallo-hydrolase [Bryobacteraceae bacterium]|nr:MBL fold metallo-hydrolase [Bryobacteraceae bacterium]